MYVRVVGFVCLSAKVRLNITETKRDSGWLYRLPVTTNKEWG